MIEDRSSTLSLRRDDSRSKFDDVICLIFCDVMIIFVGCEQTILFLFYGESVNPPANWTPRRPTIGRNRGTENAFSKGLHG